MEFGKGINSSDNCPLIAAFLTALSKLLTLSDNTTFAVTLLFPVGIDFIISKEYRVKLVFHVKQNAELSPLQFHINCSCVWMKSETLKLGAYVRLDGSLSFFFSLFFLFLLGTTPTEGNVPLLHHPRSICQVKSRWLEYIPVLPETTFS